MVLLTAEGIKKSYTEKPLLTDINLTIDSEDKIGLIGVNGTGKSTLLKIIAGAADAEDGKITVSKNLHMAYLPQNPKWNGASTVMEQAMVYIKEAGRNTEAFMCQSMLTRFGISNFDQKMADLSGGQRKRVAMAATLAMDSNLLILDEPTNHMDNDVICRLENFLINYKGAVFMITHDRYFLDRITNRIVEIDGGKLYNYDGNYDYYLEAKASRKEMEQASERKRATIYRKELAWIRRGAQARSTKAKGRIQRFHQLEDSKLVIDDSSLNLTTMSSRLGKKVIELNDISKSYGDLHLIKDFSYTLLRNDRVGIIGPNGCGKSTLLGIIMGDVSADKGTVEKGETVKIGYFSQENQVLDDKERVIKFISGIAETVSTSEGSFSASQMLERFLFPPFTHSVEIGRLSGGEKRRLFLLSVLMQAPNVLILDEPTNDLDIETLTILEDYLDDFNGAVIAVSHDRYFLDRIARKIFAFDSNLSIKEYMGGYSDYEAKLEEDEAKSARDEGSGTRGKAAGSQQRSESEETSDTPKRTRDGRPKKLKFSYKEQREYATIEADISAIEAKIASNEDTMAKNPTDSAKLSKLTKEHEELENQLLEKMERWEYLTDLAEKIETQ